MAENPHDELDRGPHPLILRVQAITERVMKLKPVRVFLHYGMRRGPILAAGLSFQAIFAVFAAIWVGFSVAGLVLASTPALQDALFEIIGTSVPGLIDTGDGSGAIDPDDLLATGVLQWTGVIALIGTLFTAIAWLASARDAVRDIAQLAAPPTNFLLLKLKDLVLALLFAVALIVSAALSFLSTQAADLVLGWFDVSRESVVGTVVVRILGLLLTFALDALVLTALYRILAGVPIPRGPLVQGVLIGATALGILKVLGATLLGGASSNPLLASFAVIVGLLIWFNFICQVILISAAWIVVSAADAGMPLDPVGDRERRDAEARLRLEIEDQVRAEVEADLPRAVRWLARRTRRRQVTEQG